MNLKHHQKTILITGAGGFLGSELINQLTNRRDYTVYALTSNKSQLLSGFPEAKKLTVYSMQDWETSNIPLQKVDTVIHCAFSRSDDGRDLARSLEFTGEILSRSCKAGVTSFINISSEGVYGNAKGIWNENTNPEPYTLYALAKFATEILMKNSLQSPSNKTVTTNLRLSSLVGDGMDTNKQNHAVKITSTFIGNAIKGEPIKIVGGDQMFSYMDVRDAASAIISLLELEPSKRKNLYNLGTDIKTSLLEVAKIVQIVSGKYIDLPVRIDVEKKDIQMIKIMDTTRFFKDTGWRPQFDMQSIIDSLFNYLVNKKKQESH